MSSNLAWSVPVFLWSCSFLLSRPWKLQHAISHSSVTPATNPQHICFLETLKLNKVNACLHLCQTHRANHLLCQCIAVRHRLGKQCIWKWAHSHLPKGEKHFFFIARWITLSSTWIRLGICSCSRAWFINHTHNQIGLPTLPMFQGAAVSSELFSQSLSPGNVAELRGSPPLRGSLDQLVRPSPAGPPLQGTELAAPSTPETNFERLVPLADHWHRGNCCQMCLHGSSRPPLAAESFWGLRLPELRWDILWVVGPRWASLQDPSVWSVVSLLSRSSRSSC